MFGAVLRYELRRAAAPMLCLYASAFAFALMARLGIFSLTDMPIVFLVIFGSTGICIYRFWRTMFGREATLLFSTVLSARDHVLAHVCAFFIAYLLTVLVIGCALIIQNEALGRLLLALPAAHLMALYAEMTISMLFTTIMLSAIIVLAYKPRCRAHSLLWTIAYGSAALALMAVLTSLTAPLISANVVLSEGGMFISDTPIHESSIALSVNELIWAAISAPICIAIIWRSTKTGLQVE
ncbi:MAG: hypothetical protein ACOYIH_06745 [Candidatus Fimadaptatus sp.]|jgi:hypothetical protein